MNQCHPAGSTYWTEEQRKIDDMWARVEARERLQGIVIRPRNMVLAHQVEEEICRQKEAKK